VDKEQPGDPSNNHQNENGCVDPLEARIVFVDGISSDARTINETVGHGKKASVLIQTGVVVVENFVGCINGEVLSIPPRSAHGSNVKEGGKISHD